MRSSLASALRGMFLMALPASLGLMILANPIVSMLYQRGEFSALTAQMTAWALTWYAAGLVGHSIMEVLTRAFFAQHDTKTPVLIGTVAMLLNVVFSIGFSRLFSTLGWMPLGGLALANSLATALEAAALFLVMRKRLGGIEGAHIARGLAYASVAGLGMSLALGLWLALTGSLNRWLVGLGGVAVGGIVYLAISLALKVPEMQMILGVVRRIVRR
jgi:putative peptidoglycan lipid II flippase